MVEDIKTFTAFKYRNFRLLWIGTVISHIGDFMQMIAQSWLVLILTNSPFAIGLVAFCQAAPRLIFSPLIGVISDRMDRKKLMIYAQWVSMLQSLIFGILVATNMIQFWQIIVLVLILGVVNSAGQLNRQAMVASIVPKECITNAVALNSGAINSAKIIGPAVAGILVSTTGVAGCLFINAASFLALIIALYMMDVPFYEKKSEQQSFISETKEAIIYILKDKEVFLSMLIIYGMGFFGMAYNRLMPIFARDILYIGPEGYGYLMTFPGVGAIITMFVIANLSSTANRSRIIIISNCVFAVSLLIFAVSKNVVLTSICLIIIGASQLFCRSLTNIVIQHNVAEDMRGRVLSFMLMDLGLWATGAFVLAALAEVTTAPFAMTIGAIFCMIVPLALLIRKWLNKLASNK